MGDNRGDRDNHHEKQLDLHDPLELRRLADELEATLEEVRQAVAKVGTSIKRIRAHLDR